MNEQLVDKLLAEVKAELISAQERHGDFSSYHEGYAVIKEEVEEMWDEIKKRRPDKYEIYKEAVQVSAMAIKMLLLIKGE